MKKILISLISFYQFLLSPDKGPVRYFGISRGFVCVFYPTCSEYSKEAIQKYGMIKGGAMSLRRIFRCHPFQKQHIDEVR